MQSICHLRSDLSLAKVSGPESSETVPLSLCLPSFNFGGPRPPRPPDRPPNWRSTSRPVWPGRRAPTARPPLQALLLSASFRVSPRGSVTVIACHNEVTAINSHAITRHLPILYRP